MQNDDKQTDTPRATPNTDAKKRTRVIDYERTDKKPHSFRYKRGTNFVARVPANTVMAKETDGVFVIGPLPSGVVAESDAAKLEDDQLQLVAIKKRPCGKPAVTFKRSDGATVVAYDARAARAALRCS